MVLQADRQKRGLLFFASASLVGNLVLILSLHAVVPNGNPGIAQLCSIGGPTRSGEDNVVGLPNQRRKAHIQVRTLGAVQTAGTIKSR